MLLKDIQSELKKIGIPIAYYQFPPKSNPKMPYLIYYDENGSERGGDFNICIVESDIKIELYANKIDKETEEKVKQTLRNLKVEFEVERLWIEKEECWETIFEFSIIDKEVSK